MSSRRPRPPPRPPIIQNWYY